MELFSVYQVSFVAIHNPDWASQIFLTSQIFVFNSRYLVMFSLGEFQGS